MNSNFASRLKNWKKYSKELKIAIKYLNENKNSMNPTIMAKIYKHLLNVEHKCSFKDFDKYSLETRGLMTQNHESIHAKLIKAHGLPYLCETNVYNNFDFLYDLNYFYSTSSEIPKTLDRITKDVYNYGIFVAALIAIAFIIGACASMASIIGMFEAIPLLLMCWIIYQIINLLPSSSLCLTCDTEDIELSTFIQMLENESDIADNKIKDMKKSHYYPKHVKYQIKQIGNGKHSWSSIAKEMNKNTDKQHAE